MDTGPALVSILRQGPYLIASIHTALDDSQLVRFQRDLIDRIGEHRSRGVIIDVAALDVLDSFGSRTLRNIAEMARLRGAVTVIVGIQPDVAFAMVHAGHGHGNGPHGTRPRGGARPTWPARAGLGTTAGSARPVNTTDALQRDYRVAFLRYVSSRDEVPLTAAYELGRRAVGERLSILELSKIHHDIVPDWWFRTARPAEMDGVVQAASEFFLEVLATYHMTHGRAG